MTGVRARTASSMPARPSMPSPVPSSVTVVRSLGTPASSHDGIAERLDRPAYSVNRGVSCSSSGPTAASAARCSSVLS